MFLKSAIALIFFTVATVLGLKGSFTTELFQTPSKPEGSNSFMEKYLKHFDTGKLPLKYLPYFQYTINLTIGTPPQPFRLKFSTTQAEFYVVSTECVENESNQKPTKLKYNQTASTTSKPTKELYFNGLVSGIKVFDVVNLGGINLGEQQFGSAKFSGFHSDKFDGIIGFGLKAIGSDNVRPIVDQLKSYLDKPQFTLAMKNSTSSKGVVSFGEYNNVNCANEISYAPIVSRSFQWQVKFSGYAIGAYKVNREQPVEPDMTFNFHIIPQAAFNSLVKQTKAIYEKATKNYFVDCNSVNTFPAIELYLGGVKYSLDGKDYTEEKYDNTQIKKCQLIVRGTTFDYWVLGDTFLYKYCVTFDVENKKLGFSKAI